MKILKNKKILFILVAFLFCLFVFSGSSKATFDFTYNDVNYSLPDLPVQNDENFLIFKGGNRFCIMVFDGSFCYSSEYISSNQKFDRFYTDGSFFKTYVYEPGVFDNYYNDSNYRGSSYYSSACPFKNLVYSSIDIYSDSTLSEVVFRKAPLKAEAVEIPTLQEAQQIPEIITKVIKMIIPVCLVILAMLLIISLIQSVIYRTL